LAIDISTLWDFNRPEISEERFRAALSSASVDDAFILQTQIARSYGLREDFSMAQQILFDIEAQIQNASAEAQARYYLELGRTYSSATHPPESQTAETQELARAAYLRAYELARDANLDSLAIDALHMLTFVDTAPEEQLEWNYKAIALMVASSQPDALKWAGALHNNSGYAMHLLGRYDDALAEFKQALAAHERNGNPQTVRIAYWMIAWTLRSLGQLNEALEIQLRLEKEWDEAGEPDPYVFEELETLYQALGNPEKAKFYASRRKVVIIEEPGMFKIIRTDSTDQDFIELVKQLDFDLAERDGAEHPFYAQFNKIDKIRYAVVAYEAGQPVGCGGIREYAPGTMEVKRMYTTPASRGKGIASKILSELEAWAGELAYEKCILETGKKQPEAIRLYQKNGYKVIPNYGQYAGVESSVCFEKSLKK
jgi:GNAT superfamily N-acetyltransferase